MEKSEIDPRYLIRPYYLRPDGKVGHDAFAVIRETIREMDKVAIGRVVLTNREHIIALEPLDKGLMGTLLRYPYEVRSEDEYFDEIQDVKVTKDMLDLAKHIVNQKSGAFEPDKFEDHYETALVDLINRNAPASRSRRRSGREGENVVDLMDALRKSVGGDRGGYQGSEERRQETTEGRGRTEGNADADRRQEAGEGVGGEETSYQTTEVGLGLFCPFHNHGLSRRTDILLVAVLVVTVLHHVDHVLRSTTADWPFKAEVTPLAAATGFALDALGAIETP